MKIKVCGIRSQAMLEACEKSGVDYVGLNFVDSSRRKISGQTFWKKVQLSSGKRVGVFWNNSEAEIRQKIVDYDLDIVQLYDADLVKRFQGKVPVWLALRVGSDDLETLKNIKPNLVLLDGACPGSGQCIDKKSLREAVSFVKDLGFDFGLAGGICEENITWFGEAFPEAIFLDTASGVEAADGCFSEDHLFRLLRLAKKL